MDAQFCYLILRQRNGGNAMAFGERLQEVRKRSGLTQEEFAEQLQVSRQSVSRWESGRGYPEMEKIIFICNRYGVTMDELFKEEVPTPGEPPVEAPLLSARTLGSELSNLYANLSPYNKSIGIMLLTVIAMIGPAYVYCMRSLKGGADEMMTIIWIAAIIIFGIAEAATAGLVSIWFVVGAVAALVATELGAAELVAFPSARCVARPDERSRAKKLERWQKIAASAAEQSGRGRIPQVLALPSYEAALQRAAQAELAVCFYENEEQRTFRAAIESAPFRTAALLTGPEGGLERSEVEQAQRAGLQICTLGSRILRCETAPLCALSALMYAAGEF